MTNIHYAVSAKLHVLYASRACQWFSLADTPFVDSGSVTVWNIATCQFVLHDCQCL